MMESQMELLRMATGTQPRVCTVVRRLSSMLFKYQGQFNLLIFAEPPQGQVGWFGHSCPDVTGVP